MHVCPAATAGAPTPLLADSVNTNVVLDMLSGLMTVHVVRVHGTDQQAFLRITNLLLTPVYIHDMIMLRDFLMFSEINCRDGLHVSIVCTLACVSPSGRRCKCEILVTVYPECSSQ